MTDNVIEMQTAAEGARREEVGVMPGVGIGIRRGSGGVYTAFRRIGMAAPASRHLMRFSACPRWE